MTPTPWLSLIGGGMLIGLAAALLILVNGRIAGISGIYSRCLTGDFGRAGWQLYFLLGLLLPAVYIVPEEVQAPPIPDAWILLAGFLVGFGTRIGSGCTSGHAICGISNLSLRSLVATLTFISMAMITVFVVHHLR